MTDDDNLILQRVRCMLDCHPTDAAPLSTKQLVSRTFPIDAHKDAYRVVAREADRELAHYCHRGPEEPNPFRGPNGTKRPWLWHAPVPREPEPPKPKSQKRIDRIEAKLDRILELLGAESPH